jgi:hypothetical protein
VKINKKRQQTFDLYKEQFDRYIADSKKEKSVIKGYQNRELLELIQNAEDECKDRQGIMKICLKNNILKIENSGNPFSHKGILSLMTVSYSPKDSNDYIGNKGLGFRAVLSWSNSVSIFSSLLSVRFSREDAAKMQNDLIEVIEEERRTEYKFDDYQIPIFSAPNTEIEYIFPSENMDTLILLECRDEAISRIKEQLNLINGKELLFLKNLGKIIIEQEQENKTYSIDNKDFKTTQNCKLFYKDCLIKTTEKAMPYQFKVYQYTDSLPYLDEENKEKTKKYIMSLAIPIDDAPSDDNLYSYFRTNIKTPFRFILNATFELTDDRKYLIDSIDENSFNNQIVSFLPEFIIEAITHNYSCKKNVDYTLLKELLMENTNFLSSNGYNFKDIYLQTLKNAKIFPTVNNEFIDYNNTPVLYKIPFAQILKGEEFNQLLQYTEDKRIIDFYDNILGRYHYSQDVMTKKIDFFSENLSIPDRVCVIKYFVDYYCQRPDNTNSFPHLLIDSNDGPIISNEIKIFNQPKEEELNSIPSFIPLKFVNRSIIEGLSNLITFNTTNKIRETIERYLKHFGVLEYSFSSLESTINSTSESDLTYSQVIDLMHWVYKVYKTQKNEDTNTLPNLKLKLPINETEFLGANKLYFGDNYKNNFYASLLKKASNNEVKFVADKDKIGFERETKDNLIPFFRWLGVENRPRKIKFALPNTLLSEYENYLADIRGFQSGQVWVYEYFDEILDKLPTIEILKWLLDEQSDTESIISSKNELQGAYINYWSRGSKQKRDNLKSFTRWRLGLKNWVDNKNESLLQQRFSLHNCLLDNIDVVPYLFNPNIEYNEIKKYNSEYTETKVNSLLEGLGAIIKLSELPFSRFYELLFQLKDIDPDMKVTRRIYKIFFDKVTSVSNNYNEFVNEESYRRFKSNGCVLSHVGKNKEFRRVDETFYSDKRDLCNGILKNMSIFDMERKLGQDKISIIFGVKTLEYAKVEIKEIELHLLNEKFKLLLNKIRPFLVVYRGDKIKQADLSTIRNMDITLCSYVEITYAINEELEKNYYLSDYENIYSRDSRKAYICVPRSDDDINELKSNYSFYESFSELLTVIFNVIEDKEIFKNLVRDELIVSQRAIEDSFGDRGLALLEQAKKDLGETETNEETFWTIIKKITKENVNELKAEYSPMLNYENTQALENSEHIISLFKILSLSIQQFNANSDGRIVLKIDSYFKNEFFSLKNELEDKYKSYLYSSISKSTVPDKSELFTKRIKDYKFRQIESNCNDINFNVQNEFEKLFNITVWEINNIKEIDIEKTKESNISAYKAKNEEKYLTLLNEYSIETIKKMALFNEFNLLSIQKPEPHQRTQDKVKEDNTEKILIAVNNNFIKGKEVNTEPPKKNTSVEGTYSPNTSNNSSPKYSDLNQIKEDIGFAAEVNVYNELSRIYGKENVDWVSTNAEKAGVLEAGQGNDKKHYDIAYFNENKIKRYVEVKGSSTADDIMFKMSRAEFDFGNSSDNINYYDIHFVTLDRGFNPVHYYIIKEFFKPREDGRKKYELINDTFTLFTKIEEEST